jgi:hypothetical protein
LVVSSHALWVQFTKKLYYLSLCARAPLRRCSWCRRHHMITVGHTHLMAITQLQALQLDNIGQHIKVCTSHP